MNQLALNPLQPLHTFWDLPDGFDALLFAVLWFLHLCRLIPHFLWYPDSYPHLMVWGCCNSHNLPHQIPQKICSAQKSRGIPYHFESFKVIQTRQPSSLGVCLAMIQEVLHRCVTPTNWAAWLPILVGPSPWAKTVSHRSSPTNNPHGYPISHISHEYPSLSINPSILR